METTLDPVRLPDGLYKVGKGRGTYRFWVQDGIMWLSLKGTSPVIWATAGKPVTNVDGHLFMRARDLMEEQPHLEAVIREAAEKHGLTL